MSIKYAPEEFLDLVEQGKVYENDDGVWLVTYYFNEQDFHLPSYNKLKKDIENGLIKEISYYHK